MRISYKIAAFICIAIGATIAIVSIVLMYAQGVFDSKLALNVGEMGSFGAFLGGAVGSAWTLGGTFLFMAALRVQQEELKQQRLMYNSSSFSAVQMHILNGISSIVTSDDYKLQKDEIVQSVLMDRGTILMMNGDPIVDESHHLYKEDEFRKEIDEAYFKYGYTICKLLYIFEAFLDSLEMSNAVSDVFTKVLFSGLDDNDVKIIIYNCVRSPAFKDKCLKSGVVNHFFSHSFIIPSDAKLLFPDYVFVDGYLALK